MTSSVLGVQRDDILPGRRKKTRLKKKTTTNERAISLRALVIKAKKQKVSQCAAPADTESVMTRRTTSVHIYSRR